VTPLLGNEGKKKRQGMKMNTNFPHLDPLQQLERKLIQKGDIDNDIRR
jgi:hypothetical protein